MKKIILTLSILICYSSLLFAQFYIGVNPKDIGALTNGSTFSFTLPITNLITIPEGNDFEVSIDDPNNTFDWVNISNENFTLYYENSVQNVTISGTVPMDWEYPSFQFLINVEDGYMTAYKIVFGTYYSNVGMEDYLYWDAGTWEFSENDDLHYNCKLQDNGDPDNIVDWNLEIILESTGGSYLYFNPSPSFVSGHEGEWQFITAPSIPTNIEFNRNSSGQIYGYVEVTGIDSDNWPHHATHEIAINATPTTPEIFILPTSSNSVELFITRSSADGYYIYYDNDQGVPYNGTGLTEGDSPIYIEGDSFIELHGLIPCTDYYFSVISVNDVGQSDYCVEKEIFVFNSGGTEPPIYITEDMNINTDFQFTDDLFIDGILTIGSGSQVNFNEINVFLTETSKIIIEPGAKLIVDGATLTGVCGQTWVGIEVWGAAYVAQLPDVNGDYPQGFLELKNGAIVENTLNGIELWRPNYWNTTGGIIKADSTTFRNNAKPVHALYYHNTNPFNPTQELDYFGRFKNCTFEVTEDYPGEALFSKHIDLCNVKGFQFEGCDFSVDPDAQEVSNYSIGISSSDAGFSATAYCTSQSTPCSAYDYCTFNGFNNGILATDANTTYTFNVERAVFTNNNYGIKVLSVDNFSVLSSEFYIGHNTTDDDDCDGAGQTASGWGVNATSSTGFAIEENYFTKTQGAPTGNYVGVRIAETNATDQIYLNQFENLSYGNYTEGKNWFDVYTDNGLAFYCNENTDNYADFYVVVGSGYSNGGVQSYQGSTSGPAGNTFTQTGATWHFYNGGNHPVIYYYNSAASEEDPFYLYNTFDVGTRYSNACSSHYGGTTGETEGGGIVLTPEETLEAEQLFASSLNEYNSVQTLYNQLKDGGNTELLKTEVETTFPDEMWEIREELLGKSPHLSMEVLKTVAAKTDVFPDAVLFEILSANPEELRKEELIDYLESKENPLPEYMIEILKQVAGGTSYKTVLEQQLSLQNQLKTRAAHDIIRSKLNDTITDLDGLRNWLDNLGGRRADEQIIASYLQQDNYADALALAATMPQRYDYNVEELQEHNLYLQMLNLEIGLRQENRHITELDSTEVSNLESIALNSRSTAGAKAKGILETQYGYHFCDCLNTQGDNGFKSSPAYNDGAWRKMFGGSIEVTPNPAGDWTSFNFSLPDNETRGEIKITDITGNTIQMFTVTGSRGSKIWDVRKMKSGIYFYTFTVNGISSNGKIIINN